jgi:hypothetical protein
VRDLLSSANAVVGVMCLVYGVRRLAAACKKRVTKNLESHFNQAKNYRIEMNPEAMSRKGAQAA